MLFPNTSLTSSPAETSPVRSRNPASDGNGQQKMIPIAPDPDSSAGAISNPTQHHVIATTVADSMESSDSQISSNANFTFVNLSEDLVSLCHRRISNKDQRHTIRSHVMQRVRQEESAQGKRRLTGREQSKKSARSKTKRLPNDSVPSRSEATRLRIIPPSVSPSPYSPQRLTLAPAVHEFDPFQTLPINNLPHQSSESLLRYCE
jgi:hypothetical protein